MTGDELTIREIDPIEEFRRQHKTAVLVMMFTDLKDSTQLAEQEGEIHSQELRERHDVMLREIIERNGAGRIIKTIGDSFMCIFAEPTAAVDCAVTIQRELAEYNRDHSEQSPINVRIGMHMGQVVVEDALQTDVFGRHVNRAARVEGLADAGQILITLPVYDSARGWLTERHLAWHDHGQYRLKGIDDPTQIFEVCIPGFELPRRPPGQRVRTRSRLTGVALLVIAIALGITLVRMAPKSEPQPSDEERTASLDAEQLKPVADLAREIDDIKNLAGFKSTNDGESLTVYADKLLDAIESSDSQIGLRKKVFGEGMKELEPAQEWVARARREALLQLLRCKSRNELVTSLCKNVYGSHWYIQLPGEEAITLIDWLRAKGLADAEPEPEPK